jgi:hypothetical protein
LDISASFPPLAVHRPAGPDSEQRPADWAFGNARASHLPVSRTKKPASESQPIPISIVPAASTHSRRLSLQSKRRAAGLQLSPLLCPHSPIPIPLSSFPSPHSPFPCPHSPTPIPHSPVPIPLSPFPCPHSSVPIPLSPFLCPHSSVLIPLSSFLCPHSSVPIPLSPFLCPHSSVLIPLSPFLCPHSSVPIPLSPFLCPHSSVPIPLSPFLCPHSSVPIPLSPFLCPHSSVLIPLYPSHLQPATGCWSTSPPTIPSLTRRSDAAWGHTQLGDTRSLGAAWGHTTRFGAQLGDTQLDPGHAAWGGGVWRGHWRQGGGTTVRGHTTDIRGTGSTGTHN